MPLFLTRWRALAACAVLVQGCALEQRAEPAVPAAVAAPQAQAPALLPAAPAPAVSAHKKAAPRPARASGAREKGAQGPEEPEDPQDPEEDAAYQQGQASWYGAKLHRRRTASGERFDMHALTAAHRTLPFGTQVCVRSLVSEKVVRVRINDRGPHVASRIIDLSRAAAKELGMLGRGTKAVALTVLEPQNQDCAPS